MSWLFAPLLSGAGQQQAGGGGSTTTLDGDNGSVAISGQAGIFRITMAAANGSIVITGQSVPGLPGTGAEGGPTMAIGIRCGI